MSRYGRYSTSDPDLGNIGSGQARAAIFGVMPENGWAYSIGGRVGSGTSVRYGLYTVSGGSPDDRMGYTASASATTAMASGAGGANVAASFSVVDSTYGTTTGVRMNSGSRYAIAAVAVGGSLNHGMIQASLISETYESFFNYASGVITIPPDPYNETSSSIEGWPSFYVDYDPNENPEVPVNREPYTTVSTTSPTFYGDFRDLNGAYGTNRGDKMKQYSVQLREVGETTLLWDTTYNASNTEQSNNRFERAYGGSALSTGTSYEWRCRVSDQFGAWSNWSSWLTFTVSGGGTVTLDGTPTGKQEAITGLSFQGRWTHQTSLSMDKVKVRLLQNGSVIGTSGEISKAAASSAAPGTLFSVSQSDSIIFNNITWGQSYEYQMQGRDSNSVWSDWSSSRSFSTNALPNTPYGLSPTGGESHSEYPLLTCTMTDPDDSSATGLVCYAVITAAEPVLPNSGFETDASNWSTYDAAGTVTITSNDVTWDNTQDYDGTGPGSGKVAITASTLASGNKAYDILYDTYIPVNTPDNVQEIWFALAVRTSNVNLVPRRVIHWYDVSQVYISSSVEADYTPTADTWINDEHYGTSPTNARYMRVGVSVMTAGSNATGNVWIDGMSFFSDVDVAVRAMSLVGGSTANWEYQTDATSLFQYDTYKWSAYGNDGSVDGPISGESLFYYAAGPVVTITSPTEAQVLAVATPTLTWTTTDQQKFRVVITDTTGAMTYYDSGEIVSTTSSHIVPSGYLFNDLSYKLTITAWNSLNQSGSSTARSFSIDYGDITPLSNVLITGTRLHFDTADSAVRLSWDETLYAPSVFSHYTIYRREATQSDAERLILRRITSPSQVSFLDMNPKGNTEYVYGVSQSILFGSSTLESAVTEGTVTLNLPYTVIAAADEADDYRVVIKYWTERGFDNNTDGTEILPWGASKPTVMFGSVYYKTFTVTARFIDDLVATKQEYENAVELLLQRRGIVCYRDPKGRRFFGVLKKTSHRDIAMATVAEIALEFTEVNYDEGVE